MERLIWVLFVPVIIVLPEGTGEGDVGVLWQSFPPVSIQWAQASK